MVWPADTDVVDFLLAVAQRHNPVDDASRVGGQRSFCRLTSCRPADDRSRPLSVVRRDLTDLLGRARCTALEGDNPRRVAEEATDPGPPVGCTMTCVAVIVVPLVVPSTRTLSPLVMALTEVRLVPF